MEKIKKQSLPCLSWALPLLKNSPDFIMMRLDPGERPVNVYGHRNFWVPLSSLEQAVHGTVLLSSSTQLQIWDQKKKKMCNAVDIGKHLNAASSKCCHNCQLYFEKQCYWILREKNRRIGGFGPIQHHSAPLLVVVSRKAFRLFPSTDEVPLLI